MYKFCCQRDTWELFPSEPLHRRRGVCALRGLWETGQTRDDLIRSQQTRSVPFPFPLPADLLLWELPLELVLPDSRCASSSIFSTSPSWAVVGICSWLPWWLVLWEAVPPKWSSTQDSENQFNGDDLTSLTYIFQDLAAHRSVVKTRNILWLRAF